MSAHPSSLALESYAVGERSAAVEEHLATCAECTGFVDRLAKATSSFVPRTEPRRPKVAWIVGTVGLPLAAAATLLMTAHTPTAPTAPTTTATTVPAPRTAEVTFKGDILVAIVRERGARQERFTGPVRVRPGDRLRIEIGLDHEQAVAGGLLGDDGSYVELIAGATRTTGTYFSDRSAKVDAEPTNGIVIVGTPANVAAARDAKRFAGVKILRVVWEKP